MASKKLGEGPGAAGNGRQVLTNGVLLRTHAIARGREPAGNDLTDTLRRHADLLRHALLIIHAEAVLSSPSALQRLEAIIRWHAQIREATRNLQLPEFPASDRLDAREPLGALAARQRFSLAITWPGRDA